MSNRLMLMARALKRPGWLTHDGNPEHHPDIVGMIPPLPAAILDGRWDSAGRFSDLSLDTLLFKGHTLNQENMPHGQFRHSVPL
jgi:hypothetical protein